MLTFNFEDMYFSIAEKSTQNVLIIADRGVMNASTVIAKEAWDRILTKLSLAANMHMQIFMNKK